MTLDQDEAAVRWEPFRSRLHYLGLPGSLTPPIWNERLVPRAALARLQQARPPAPPPPAPHAPVLVVPGFASGDHDTVLLREWLADGGWDVHASGLSEGLRCSSRDLEVAEQTFLDLAARTGRRVTLVGHSRGGMFAKVLAVRHPDLVDRLVTLGAPLVDPFGVHVVLRVVTAGMSVVSRLGLRDWVRECPVGDCCRAVHDDALARVDRRIPFTSLTSRRDGIVQWGASHDPSATVVEVTSTHGGMLVDPDTWSELADALRV